MFNLKISPPAGGLGIRRYLRGSSPPLFQGLHFITLLSDLKDPIIIPYLSIAL